MQKHLWAGDRRFQVKVPECLLTKVCIERFSHGSAVRRVRTDPEEDRKWNWLKERPHKAAGWSQTTLDGIDPMHDVCPEGPEVELSGHLCSPGSKGDEIIPETSHRILTWTV